MPLPWKASDKSSSCGAVAEVSVFSPKDLQSLRKLAFKAQSSGFEVSITDPCGKVVAPLDLECSSFCDARSASEVEELTPREAALESVPGGDLVQRMDPEIALPHGVSFDQWAATQVTMKKYRGHQPTFSQLSQMGVINAEVHKYNLSSYRSYIGRVKATQYRLGRRRLVNEPSSQAEGYALFFGSHQV